MTLMIMHFMTQAHTTATSCMVSVRLSWQSLRLFRAANSSCHWGCTRCCCHPDSAMYRETRVEHALRSLFPFTMYGNAAYGMRPWLLKGFHGMGHCRAVLFQPTLTQLSLMSRTAGRPLTAKQREFNKHMSTLSRSVEDNFGVLKVTCHASVMVT